MAEKNLHSEAANLQERLEVLPVNEREKLEKSWDSLKAMIPEGEPPEGINISKVEFKNSEERRAKVDEMQKFLLKAFEGEEMVDEMQMDIGMQHEIVDYYEARDAEGKMVSLLSSQMVESKNKLGESELSMVVWYVANDPDYKGKSVTKQLGAAALEGFLQKAKDQLKPAKAILGEAELGDEDEAKREKAFNRYADMKRLYGKDKKGKLFEVLYEAPPEDESTKGAPAHFMAKMVDGNNTLSKGDYMELVKGIHAQYTRPEYSTPEYAAFEYGGKPEDYSLEKVEGGRQRYIGVVENIQTKIEKKLKPAQGDLVFLSEREFRKEL
ncbi:MAG: hypothetical protein NT026_02990 [Candidatus Staskawiczbacteria bacterium]|nr:hypothetical protein [Candidatus Staskawiczbacteria bacterium]